MAEWKSPRALHAIERRVLRWLRLAAIDPAPDADSHAGRARSPLAGIVQGHIPSRSIFLATDAPFVAPKERDFLTLTAYYQRCALPPLQSDPTLTLAAAVAAQLLIAGVRLPPPISSDPPGQARPHIWPLPLTGEVRIDGEVRAGTIRARIIGVLDRQGSASREELLALGMSRQYLSLLVRSGMLVRVGKTFHRSARGNAS